MLLAAKKWSLQQVSGQPPPPRYDHACVVRHGRPEIYIFGGSQENHPLNDVHILNTDTWTWHTPKVTGLPPEPRAIQTAPVVNDTLYLFGGQKLGLSSYFATPSLPLPHRHFCFLFFIICRFVFQELNQWRVLLCMPSTLLPTSGPHRQQSTKAPRPDWVTLQLLGITNSLCLEA
eukprot:m.35601 g.35601  ORF g.35601 m.35601 type:complete len:175 (-) comp15781_c1_seq1:354-878(-)